MNDNELKELKSKTLMTKIIGGLLLPIGFIWYGIYVFVNPSLSWVGKGGNRMVLHGVDAVLLGVILVVIGALMHIHLTWLSKRMWVYYLVNTIQILILLGLIAVMAILFIRVIIL